MQPRTGLSLYANLLDPSASKDDAPGTISRAPVVFNQDEDASRKQISAAALRFQPTKRPQLQTQKPKPRSAFPKPPPSSSDPIRSDSPSKLSAPAPQPTKTTIADWTGDDDDINGFYAGNKRQRGGRKAKRKKEKEERPLVQDWDDIYDPSRPNNYEDYKHSDEKYREIREWKDKLYAHRTTKKRSTSDLSDDSDDAPARTSTFAPPTNYSFAPPSFKDPATSSSMPAIDKGPTEIPDDVSGEDAYTRRMHLSTTAPAPASPPRPQTTETPQPTTEAHPKPPTPPPSGTISRAPVRYQLPSAPTNAELSAALEAEDQADATESAQADQATDVEPVQRSLRPGQKGFAARLMAKHGWSAGQGLGASGSGIVAPLRVQIEKRKKRSDAQGGGFVGPAGKGKIIGSKTNAPKDDPRGRISDVVLLQGMLDGLDLEGDNGDGLAAVMQEIGDECSEKYGTVERVFINRAATSSKNPVFVKFTSELSALRAVQALQGRVFDGNAISARYFDSDAFAQGLYE